MRKDHCLKCDHTNSASHVLKLQFGVPSLHANSLYESIKVLDQSLMLPWRILLTKDFFFSHTSLVSFSLRPLFCVLFIFPSLHASLSHANNSSLQYVNNSQNFWENEVSSHLSRNVSVNCRLMLGQDRRLAPKIPTLASALFEKNWHYMILTELQWTEKSKRTKENNKIKQQSLPCNMLMLLFFFLSLLLDFICYSCLPGLINYGYELEQIV